MFHRPTSFKIAITMQTKDARIANFCNRYWEFDETRSTFLSATDSLSAELGLPRNKALKLISESCAALAVAPCTHCRAVLEIKIRNRTEFTKLLPGVLCAPCRQKQKDAQERLAQLHDDSQRRREAVVDQILVGKLSEEPMTKEHRTNSAETSARVQVDTGGIRSVVRFTKVNKYEFNLDLGDNSQLRDQAGTSQRPAKSILKLEGEVDLGTAASLNNDSFGYFVRVYRDGGFTVFRARTEPTLAKQSAVVLEEEVGNGQSTKNELWNELYSAIHGDFMELPQPEWDREEERESEEEERY